MNDDKSETLELMDTIHNVPYPKVAFNGQNANDQTVVFDLYGETYLIPPFCKFYNKNVSDLASFLALDNQYDVIVMDPPWRNKYIRRVNGARRENGYDMLSTDDIKGIPVEGLLSPNGLVCIWCTNNPGHQKAVQEELLPKWNLELVTTWYWMKVTSRGEPVCEFREGATQKQPFEIVFVAVRKGTSAGASIAMDRLLMSTPSVIHSHKMPFLDLITPYTVDQPNCLELFARYLQPRFTSVGLEVLKLQNTKLFIRKDLPCS